MADVAWTTVNELSHPSIGGMGSVTLKCTLTSTDADSEELKIGANWVDATLQFTGTFDSATLVVKGSNDQGTTYLTQNDVLDAAMSYTSAPTTLVAPKLLGQRMQLQTTGGGGSQSIVCYLCARIAHGT